ncbi:MAG: hypothetical protein K0S40_3464, partial [Actinomycetospora sp.]|nr:hypothetical protein [Actinomycetospora sp.]
GRPVPAPAPGRPLGRPGLGDMRMTRRPPDEPDDPDPGDQPSGSPGPA